MSSGNGLTKSTYRVEIANQCLNPFLNKPWFFRVCRKSLLKTLWEKEKLLVTSNFSFSHSVFYHFIQLSTIFIKSIVVCKLFQFGECVWERVNSLPNNETLDMIKLLAFADEKLNIIKVTISLCDRVENYCSKRREFWLPAFSPFPKLFSRAFFFRVVNSQDAVVELKGPITLLALNFWLLSIFPFS